MVHFRFSDTKLKIFLELGDDIRRSTGIRTRVILHVEAARVLLRFGHQAGMEATPPSIQIGIRDELRKIVRSNGENKNDSIKNATMTVINKMFYVKERKLNLFSLKMIQQMRQTDRDKTLRKVLK